MKTFSKIEKTLKIRAVFWFFSKNGLFETIKENFIKNIEKKIKIDIFLLSSTSSIQPCRKKTKKKFA
jgi:hypothetical protein